LGSDARDGRNLLEISSCEIPSWTVIHLRKFLSTFTVHPRESGDPALKIASDVDQAWVPRLRGDERWAPVMRGLGIASRVYPTCDT
jgi:hypothetical protein